MSPNIEELYTHHHVFAAHRVVCDSCALSEKPRTNSPKCQACRRAHLLRRLLKTKAFRERRRVAVEKENTPVSCQRTTPFKYKRNPCKPYPTSLVLKVPHPLFRHPSAAARISAHVLAGGTLKRKTQKHTVHQEEGDADSQFKGAAVFRDLVVGYKGESPEP